MTEDSILKDYIEGLSAQKVAKKHGLKPHQVYWILQRNGVPRRSNKQTSRRYSLNEHFFERIDSEDTAYWLGFLYADGCITRPSGKRGGEWQCKLDLAAKDRTHLEKFALAVGTDKPIRDYSNKSVYGGPYCRLSLYSEKLCLDLIQHGCAERKTFTAIPPTLAPDLERHFIRGLFDGDGSVKVHKATKSGFLFGLNGTRDMLEWVNDRLPRPGAIQQSRGVWATSSHSDNVVWLYDNANIYLDRKYDRYLSIQQTS